MIKPSKRALISGQNDLAHSMPLLAAEWHPSKNEGVTPEQVLAKTEQKAWWLCERGHEWEANVRNRSVLGAGCPFCSGRRVSPGENDLVTTHPHLAAEWHPIKNSPSLPSEVSAGVGKKYWWQCTEKHEWEESPNARTREGRGKCPVCSNQRVVAGVNDFATRFPKFASMWHPTKNAGTEVASISLGQSKKYWWLCTKGHSFRCTAVNLVRGRSCGVCANRQVERGVNDLATTHPALAAQWHPEANGNLLPVDVIASTSQLVWWLCEEGHKWKAKGEWRLSSPGCPVCGNRTRTPVAGVNDLATTHPELARRWHPSKNGETTPKEVFAGARAARWWICEKGHEFRATGESMVNNVGCGVCANRQIQVGENDMATTHPNLASQWHPTKNLPLTPLEVIGSHSGKLWWICDEGHEFISTGQKRAAGSQCPVCINQQVLTGFNDLATVNPDLAKDWHPTRNGRITPEIVLCGGHAKYWWICEEGHQWKTDISSRLRGTGCPSCAKSGFDSTKAGLLYFISHAEFRALKVGITNIGTTRLERFVKAGWRVEYKFESWDGEQVRSIETEIFRWIRGELGLPQYLGKSEMGALGGYSETFSADEMPTQQVIDRIKNHQTAIRRN